MQYMSKEDLIGRFDRFVEKLKTIFGEDIHSIHIVGSVLNEDFIDGVSDLNSVVVFKRLRFSHVEALAPLGKEFRKKRIAAPWLMDPEYIHQSLDAFPVEFLNFQLLHRTVQGEDILKDLPIERSLLRVQLERELKSRLIWLRQGYLSTMGEPAGLSEHLKGVIKSMVPLLRALCFLKEKEVPVASAEALFEQIGQILGINISALSQAWAFRRQKKSLPKSELDALYERLYETTEEISHQVDRMD